MHESFRSVRPSWIAFGWFIAASIASLILLTLDVAGITGVDALGESLWVAVALLISFAVAGFFVGTRVVAAPILHGVGIGLFSLIAWVGINLLAGEPTGETTWRALDATTLVGLLVLQGAAAIVGTRLGVRWMRTPVAPPN
jgi:hypothetical protein